MTDVRSVVLDESVRNLQNQATILDGLRDRAGTLLAAAALVTAFLAPPALKVTDSSGKADYAFSYLSWAATGCFVGAVLMALLVLLPKRKWLFGHDIWTLMDQFFQTDPKIREDAEALRYHLTYYNEKHHRSNSKKMGWLFWWFGLGCALLAAEIGLWLAAIVH